MDKGDFMENTNSSEHVSRSKSSALFIGIGWLSAIISLFAFPFVFGVLGVILGILATKKGSRAGLTLIMASIILMAVGLLFSGTIMNYFRHYTGIGA